MNERMSEPRNEHTNRYIPRHSVRRGQEQRLGDGGHLTRTEWAGCRRQDGGLESPWLEGLLRFFQFFRSCVKIRVT